MPGERRVEKPGIGAPAIVSIASFITVCDQATKFLIRQAIQPGVSRPVIAGIFHLTLIRNKGAAFGIFKAQTPFFIALGIIATLLIMYYLPRLGKKDLPVKIALALMMGGIVGNLIDRIRLGYVVDFLDFRVWPVFNVADSAITIGAAVLIANIIAKKGKA
jgi:signal peptidase II